MMWIDVDDEPEQMEVDHESLSGFAHALLRLPGDGDWPFVRIEYFTSEEGLFVMHDNDPNPSPLCLLSDVKGALPDGETLVHQLRLDPDNVSSPSQSGCATCRACKATMKVQYKPIEEWAATWLEHKIECNALQKLLAAEHAASQEVEASAANLSGPRKGPERSATKHPMLKGAGLGTKSKQKAERLQRKAILERHPDSGKVFTDIVECRPCGKDVRIVAYYGTGNWLRHCANGIHKRMVEEERRRLAATNSSTNDMNIPPANTASGDGALLPSLGCTASQQGNGSETRRCAFSSGDKNTMPSSDQANVECQASLQDRSSYSPRNATPKPLQNDSTSNPRTTGTKESASGSGAQPASGNNAVAGGHLPVENRRVKLVKIAATILHVPEFEVEEGTKLTLTSTMTWTLKRDD